MKRTLIASSAMALMLLAGSSQAADELNSQSNEVMNQSFPELLETKGPVDTRASGGMSCFVDTPAFDVFTAGACFSIGFAPSTTAVFRITNRPSNFRVIWSDNRCNQNSDTCFLPISFFQTINLSATVLNLSNNTFFTASATANYEGFF